MEETARYAYFKDSEGNIVGVSSDTASRGRPGPTISWRRVAQLPAPAR